jgi:large subunit ribosomal protein L19
MNIIESLVPNTANPKVGNMSPGDTVKVKAKIIEAGKEHTQTYQGVVIKMKGGGAGASFTIRRISNGVGVESTFPIYSPWLESAEVMRHGEVRRAKLYYLRGRSGKDSRIREKRGKAEEAQVAEVIAAEAAAAPVAETPETK